MGRAILETHEHIAVLTNDPANMKTHELFEMDMYTIDKYL